MNTAGISFFAAKLRSKTFLYHSAGWALFIFYEVFFVTVILGTRSNTSAWKGYIFPYLVNICLFYFHAHVTLSTSFRNGRNNYLKFVLLVLLEFLLYIILINAYPLAATGFKWPVSLDQKNITPMLRQLWRGIYFIGFSSAYWFAIRAVSSEKKILQLEKLQVINQAEKHSLEKNIVELQNAYLQSQINPHLLFNTLNFIYNSVQQVSAEAAEALILLTELMNYSLRELEADGKVSLDKEIEQIINIIKINQIRFNKKVFLDIETNGDFANARIIPLILIPIIENIFKHGNLSGEDAPGKITINYDDGYLEMRTVNQRKKRNKVYSHGIGMVNIKKRLTNYYKDQYVLTMDGDEQNFYVFLGIKLNLNYG